MTKTKSGARFKSFEHELARRGGVANPNATAASIGRAKSGEVRMGQMSGGGAEINVSGRRRNPK